jgi:hypothetical protein
MEARIAAGHPRCPPGPRLKWFWKNIKKELDSKRKDAMFSRFIESCKKKREEKIGQTEITLPNCLSVFITPEVFCK